MSKSFKGEQLDLLLRKGVDPYDYMEQFEKLKETLLPPKREFYSKMNNTHISDEDYKHAQTVWKEFGLSTMRDLYLKVDVLLLADVFENFRNVCSSNYQLDPAWYFTAPGLAWDACLKVTAVELELLSDQEMLLLIEEGIFGGISTITTRYGKANNPYMNEYDPAKGRKLSLTSTQISYMDGQ